MKVKILAIAITLSVIACKDSKKLEQNQAANDEKSSMGLVGDYLYAKNRDTVFLSIQDSNNVISGKLDMLPYEKDGEIGTIENGQMKGDTLFATYNAMQEGQQTEYEIALLKVGDAYIMSNDVYGSDNYQYNADYSKGIYKNKNKIKFDGDTLKKIR